MDQEQIMQFQMIEQEANQINQQLEIIDSNIAEINDINASLDELQKDETKEFLANLGKKIYLPVEIKDKKLIVEVGNKNFVKKTIPETKEIIEEQLNKLGTLRNQFSERVEAIEEEMKNLIKEINGAKSPEDPECQCGHDHKCEDCDCDEEECE